MNIPRVDYDSRWKEIIEAQFEDFIAFFLPTLYPEIDFEKKPEFLEQELHKLFADTSSKGKNVNDKLVKVFTKEGNENVIFIHIEVEGSKKSIFSERMFRYFYRIFDKKKIPLTAIAIFIGEKHPKTQNSFTYEFHGTRISYEYNTYRIDQQKEEELLASDNPFALVVLANLFALKTKGKYKHRLATKIKLLDILKKRNFSREKIVNLIIFIRIVLVLPEDLEIAFNEFVKTEIHQSKKHMATRRPEDKAYIASLLADSYGPDFVALINRVTENGEISLQKVEEYKQELKQEAEAQKQEAEAQKQELKREAEAQKQELKREAEAQRREAEAQKRELEKKARELENGLINSILSLYSQANFTIPKIAELLDVPESYVISILNRRNLLD